MPLFKKSDTVGLLCRPTVKAAVPAAVISRANTMRTLGALADFGALKSESIAALCFPAPRYSQGLLMAQRKLKNLAASKLVIPRLDAHGTRSWVLSTAGAALVDAQDGYELNPAGGTYSHHHLGSRYLIFKQATQGYACYSEHAFTHNRAPFRASDLLATLGKVPDGILMLPGGNPRAVVASPPQQTPQVWALETEIAIKPEHQISKQLSILVHLGKRVFRDLPHEFAGLIVLFPADLEWHAARLKKAAENRWGKLAAPQALADRVVIARAQVGAGWAFQGVEETKLIL